MIRLAAEAADSVIAEERGRRKRGNAMLTMIEPRPLIAVSAPRLIVTTNWNGTIAQTRLSPISEPDSLKMKATSTR